MHAVNFFFKKKNRIISEWIESAGILSALTEENELGFLFFILLVFYPIIDDEHLCSQVMKVEGKKESRKRKDYHLLNENDCKYYDGIIF